MHDIVTTSGKTFAIDEIIVIDGIEHRCTSITWEQGVSVTRMLSNSYLYHFARWDS